MAKENKEVKLPAPFLVTGRTNTQLRNGIESRFKDITVKLGDRELPFLVDSKHAGNTPDETRDLVYAAVLAVTSATSGGGDGAVIYLDEFKNHPKVEKLFSKDTEIVFTLSSSRTGLAGYRYSGPTIKTVVTALAPVFNSGITEFGYPRPITRGSKAVEEEVDIDFDL